MSYHRCRCCCPQETPFEGVVKDMRTDLVRRMGLSTDYVDAFIRAVRHHDAEQLRKWADDIAGYD